MNSQIAPFYAQSRIFVSANEAALIKHNILIFFIKIKASEQHTVTDLVNFVYYPTCFVWLHKLHQGFNKIYKWISNILDVYNSVVWSSGWV